MFAGSGVETVVYLGNMTSFKLTLEQTTKLNVLMPNTTAQPTLSATGNTNGSSVYLCELNKSFAFDENTWKDETVHFEDPSKSVITKEPTCVDNAKINITCFCGEYIGEVEKENSTNDGKHDLENAKAVNIVYAGFASTGTKMLKCSKCGAEDIIEEAPPLFTCLGYSAPEDGRGGIAIGFTVNNIAIAEYEEATGKTLKYGVFAVLQSKLKDKDVFAEDGTVAEGVINADITSYEFALFELKIVGFTDEYKDIKLAMGAYVAVTDGETTEYSYLQSGTPNENEKYCFVSYNDIVGAPSTDEEVIQ